VDADDGGTFLSVLRELLTFPSYFCAFGACQDDSIHISSRSWLLGGRWRFALTCHCGLSDKNCVSNRKLLVVVSAVTHKP